MTTRIGTVFADGLILLVFVIALFFIHLMSGSRKQLIYGAEDRISVEKSKVDCLIWCTLERIELKESVREQLTIDWYCRNSLKRSKCCKTTIKIEKIAL